MPYKFDHKLFLAVKPRNLKDFYTNVLGKNLPPQSERAAAFEDYGLGLANDYLGTAGQNQALLEMLYLLVEQEN